MQTTKLSAVISLAVMAISPLAVASDHSDKQALIDEALTAAPPTIADSVTVMDWEGNVLREGDGEYTCYPTPPQMKEIGSAPMCFDEVWQAWGDAWMNEKPFEADRVGVAYMLAGDTGSSNVDPYAEGPTEDNEWIVEGPHLMVLAPRAQFEGLSTDPSSGGAYVMWKGTPYAHIMIPVGARPSD